MNCYYHPERPAVAQCVDCGKGLCQECASMNAKSIPVCPSCAKRRLRKGIFMDLTYLIVLIIVYIIGYHVGMNTEKHENLGYMFVAIWTGLGLMSGKFEVPFGAAFCFQTAGCMMLALKFLLAMVVGTVFTIPIVLWKIYCLIRNIYYMATWYGAKE